MKPEIQRQPTRDSCCTYWCIASILCISPVHNKVVWGGIGRLSWLEPMNAHRGSQSLREAGGWKGEVLAWGCWILYTWKSPLEGGVVCKCSAHGLSPRYKHQLVLVTLAEGLLPLLSHCHSEKEQCCGAGKTQQPGNLPETLMSIRCGGL